MPQELHLFEESTDILSEDGLGNRSSNVQDSLEFSPNELSRLINKLEDVVEAIKARRSDNQPSAIRRNTCFMRLWAWIVKYFLAVTTIWQVACITLLSVIEVIKKKDEEEKLSHSLIISTIILTLCQAVLILVVICMSIKITKQYLHMTLTPWFLLQAYLSSILVFTGIYTLYIRVSTHSFRHVGNPSHGVFAFEVYSKMLFFSVSTATLCGVSLTFPNKWYAYITVAIQMLLSFLYFASILSVVINRPRKKKPTRNHERTGLLNRYGTDNVEVSEHQT